MTIRKKSEHALLIRQILSFATYKDAALLCIGSIGAMVQGALQPLMCVVFASMSTIFADVTSGRLSEDDFVIVIGKIMLYFLYLAIGELVGSYAMWIGFTLGGQSICARMRRSLLVSVFHQGVSFLDKAGTVHVNTLLGADADAVNDAISSKLGRVIASTSSVLVAFAVSFARSWLLTLILGSGVLALAVAAFVGTLFVSRFTKRSSAALAEATSVAEETISGIVCAMTNGAESILATRYQNSLSRCYRPAVFARIAGDIMAAVIMTIALSLFGLAFWRGSRYYFDGQTGFADVLTVLLAVLTGTSTLGLIGPNAQAVSAGATAARRLLDAMAKPYTIDSMSMAGTTPIKISGKIEFDRVDFAYPTRPNVKVLTGFSLSIPAGSTTALVGPSGCGKSTIVKLLQRFYDPSHGTIFLDGRPLTSLSLRWLRENMAVVHQDTDLFNASVYDNIRYGLLRSRETLTNQQERDKIMDAAEAVGLHHIIMSMPDGYQTSVGEKGSRLSGGQRQRLAIARALVSGCKVLLLDEATSALDTVSERYIQEAMAAFGKDRTVIIIAHRLSTIQNADNIVVMTPDGIAEQGRYDNLVRRKGAFSRLHNMEIVDREHLSCRGALERRQTHDTIITAQSMSTAGPSDGESTGQLLSGSRASLEEGSRQHKACHASTTASASDIWRFLIRLNTGKWGLATLGLLWAVISGCAPTVHAFLFANAVLVFGKLESDKDEYFRKVDFWAALQVGFACAQGIASTMRSISLAICSENSLAKARTQALDHILRQDMAFFAAEGGTSKLTSFVSTTIGELDGLSVSSMSTWVGGLVGLVSAVAMSIGLHWKLALVYTSAVPFLLAAGYVYAAFASKREQKARQWSLEAVVLACESVDCLSTVVSLGLEQYMEDRFWQPLVTQSRRRVRKDHLSCGIYALSQAVVYLCLGGALYYGGRLIAAGEVSMLDFYICYIAVVVITPAAGACFNLLPDIRKASNACGLLLALLARQPTIDPTKGPEVPVPAGGVKLTLDDVYFRYPTSEEAYALLGIDINARPGQYIGLCGPSGGGKSTILSLIERFYDPQRGAILNNGIDIRCMGVRSHRKCIALITQETTLFSGSIRENLLLASPSATEQQIREAINAAALGEFVASLPEGLDTAVGHRGLSLSGGQRQRLAIARALLNDSPVLLLDEATSSLDRVSELMVQSAIDYASHGRTTIAVAQRLSTIQHADWIYVIEHGRVVEQGTHRDLMRADMMYASLVRMQH